MKILNILLLSSLTSVAIADTTLTYKDQNDKVVMKMQFSGHTMRATSMADGTNYMIYDADKETFTSMMSDKKEYVVMGKKEIDALGDPTALVNSMLDKQLAGMPAAQRDMMRKMLASTMKAQLPKKMPAPVYTMTDKTSSYNKFDCKIVTKKSQKETSEFCVSDYTSLGMKSSDYSTIESFQNIVRKLAAQYASDKSMDFSSLGKLLPVHYSQGGKEGTLSAISHNKIDAGAFAIPKGYKQVKIPFGK
jgi:hypothetical protein